MTETPPKLPALRILAPLLAGVGLVAVVLLGLRGGLGPDAREDTGGAASTLDPTVPADRIRAVGRLGELPLSSVTVPIAFDAERVLAELEDLVPGRFGGMASRRAFPAIPGAQYAFEAVRGPLRAEVHGDTVRVSAVVRYGGRLWYRPPFGPMLSAGCGVTDSLIATDAPRAVVTFASPIEIGPGWTLRSDVTVERVEPMSDSDRCRIQGLPLEIDGTDAIMAAAHEALEADAAEIQRTLSGIDLGRYAEGYWAELRRPVEVAPDIWLTLGPEAIRIAAAPAPSTEETTFTGRLEVTARPRIAMGPRPSASAEPLPPPAASRSGAGTGVLVEGRADYADLSTFASNLLRDREFQVAGRLLRITDVRISGVGGGRIAVELDVTGGAQARIRLEGTPAWDPGPGSLSFPDLSYSVQGGGFVRLAAWATRVFLPGYVRERTRIPVAQLLDAGRLGAGQEFDVRIGPQARLAGSVGDLQITEIAATPSDVIVRSRVDADALLRIGPEVWAQ